MSFVLFLLVTFFITFIILSRPTIPKPQESSALTKKSCPPHKWSWEAICDQDGKHIRDRVICANCGPLRKD